MDDFARILSVDVLISASRAPGGTELLIPYPQVGKAIHEATAHQIAVLGVEIFRILEDGLGVESYSNYGFDYLDLEWPDYVARNNHAASRFLADNSYGVGYAYILTTSSRDEAKAVGYVR